MHHFFVSPSQVEGDHITIRGTDVNHMKNVLRMKPGEQAEISDGSGERYLCEVEAYTGDEGRLFIVGRQRDDRELPAKLYLFQGLPKGDKMELIIQKAVELGVYEVIPVATKRAVVKLDEKKAEKKVQRWNMIAEGAAKQSGRGVIPEVHGIMSFPEALRYANKLDMCLIPYEKAEGMQAARSAIGRLRPGMSAGIFIGPEGGFEESEIALAEEQNVEAISLGKRILRTETASLAILSVMMYHLECGLY